VRRLVSLVLGVLAVVFVASAAAGDWPQFGYGPSRTNSPAAATGITAANVGKLVRQQVRLDGIADSNAIYLHGAQVGGAAHDAFFVTTSYGRTIAIDASTGATLWEYVPPGIATWEHSAQIMTAAPAADPSWSSLYAASPDGKIHKLSIADGSEITAGGWPVTITLDPKHEKIGPGINVSGNLVLATTGGYIGDIPPYQGHVVTIDRSTGRLLHVFNALCSNRHTLIQPTSCIESGAAIWGRGGAVVEPGSHKLLVATGNATYNGRTMWGDSVLELSPDATALLHNWTPTNQAHLDATDLDVGSTSPALVPSFNGMRLALQAGKGGVMDLLNLDRLNGTTGGAGSRLGGQVSETSTPGGDQVLTQPAVWTSGGHIYVFVADSSATAAYELVDAGHPRLRQLWQTGSAGSSPVVAGGLLYVYDPGGTINIRRPLTGAIVRSLPAGGGHWNSPIVTDGRLIEPTGAYGSNASSSVIDIWHLPGR